MPREAPPRPRLREVTPEELDSGAAGRLEEELERGRVLVLPPGLLPLPPEEDQRFLREELAASLSLKNISYHPEEGYLSGLKGSAAAKARTERILAAHDRTVREVLGRALPGYARGWRVGKVNFRPLEEEGRELSRHSSNELVHVDAFASGATHGGRILRVFTNLHPSKSRVWKSSGLFPELFAEFGHEAGIAELGQRGLAEGPGDRALSGLLHGIARAGIGRAAMADSSPYDRAMRRMHNWLKDSDAFQADEGRQVRMEFPPYTTWAVLTDMVSHAVERGRHALVSTFCVPLELCRLPELAPYHVIADAAG